MTSNAPVQHPTQWIGLVLVIGLLAVGCGDSGPMSEEGISFDSGLLNSGETFSVTFQSKGSEYYCKIHETIMQGVVLVESNASRSGTVNVSMRDTSFRPKQITVQPGTKVVWTNNDPTAHTVTSGNPSSGNEGGNGGPY